MSAMETGGPAFPAEHGRYQNNREDGMSLRDYFAAKAMQGFAADPNASWPDGMQGMADCAYRWADAMLEARKK